MHCREDWIACLDHANDGFDGVELFSEETASTSPICLKRGAWRSRGTRIAGIESRPTHGYKWDCLPDDELEGRFRELIARCMRMGIREVNMHLHFLANRAQGMARALNATDACMDLMEQADLLLLYENVPEHGNRELGSEIADLIPSSDTMGRGQR